MSDLILGGVCLIIGAIIGVFTLALVSINRYTESAEPKEGKQNADR